jgi:hypothetical protein
MSSWSRAEDGPKLTPMRAQDILCRELTGSETVCCLSLSSCSSSVASSFFSVTLHSPSLLPRSSGATDIDQHQQLQLRTRRCTFRAGLVRNRAYSGDYPSDSGVLLDLLQTVSSIIVCDSFLRLRARRYKEHPASHRSIHHLAPIDFGEPTTRHSSVQHRQISSFHPSSQPSPSRGESRLLCVFFSVLSPDLKPCPRWPFPSQSR